MALPEKVTCKDMANNVIEFVLCELADLRKKSESSEQLPIRQTTEMNFTAFYQCIGKAASLFALMHQNKVVQKLEEVRKKVFKSPHKLDTFIQTFSDKYYEDTDTAPAKYFHIAVLMFCGVIGAMVDYFSELNKPYLAEVCCINLELDLNSCILKIEALGGWQGFYDAADEFAKAYDSRYWINETSGDENVQEK